jgi:hypothetical protein
MQETTVLGPHSQMEGRRGQDQPQVHTAHQVRVGMLELGSSPQPGAAGLSEGLHVHLKTMSASDKAL